MSFPSRLVGSVPETCDTAETTVDLVALPVLLLPLGPVFSLVFLARVLLDVGATVASSASADRSTRSRRVDVPVVLFSGGGAAAATTRFARGMPTECTVSSGYPFDYTLVDGKFGRFLSQMITEVVKSVLIRNW